MNINFLKSAKEQSIRKQIARFNTIALFVILALLLFYNLLNRMTMDKYNSAFMQYSNVSQFYDSLGEANGSFKDFLYTDTDEGLQEFEANIDIAYDHVTSLIHSDFLIDNWRALLLRNMLDSYIQKAEMTKTVFQENGENYSAEYTQLLHIYDLISKTSDTYYDILTDQMETQNEQLIQIDRYTTLLSIVVGLVCIIWLAGFTKNTMQAITKPLGEIFKNINKIKRGEYDLSEISNTGNEMHELCDALNEMAEVIQKEIVMTKERGLLEKRLLEIENENLRKDEMLVQSEVKMLQNQINPHFLFNTLNMTYKLALQEGAPRSSEMIERTSALLRYGLDKQNKLSDLQAEINAVENYLAIQEKRLGERVRFELIADQELPNINIPGMILQPLVENSLKHGLKDCIEDGEVIISIYYADGIINIQVSDNGVGMDSDLLEEMQLNGFHQGDEDHLGLYNVTKRLEMFYRDQVDIGVSSSVGCGFEFSIKIEVQPYEKEFFKYTNSRR